MNKSQFFILLTAFIPLFDYLFAKLAKNLVGLSGYFSKLLPILFLFSLIGAYKNQDLVNSYLALTANNQNFSPSIGFDKKSFFFQALLGVLWLIFTFYWQHFSELLNAKNNNNFRHLFTLIVGFLNLMIMSKNLISILFFYSLLLILCHFFILKFLRREEAKISRFFAFLPFLQSAFLFLAIAATYKFKSQFTFSGENFVKEAEFTKSAFVLSLYFGSIFLPLLSSFYLFFYRQINFEPITVYALLFMAYGLSAVFIFIKIVGAIFGFEGFAALVFELRAGIIFKIIQWIFLANLLVSSWFLLFSKELKSSFFYLFFQQFICALFAIFIFSVFDRSKICLTLVSFSLSFTLVFLTISNFILYLKKSGKKWFNGIFYELKITTILFVFAIVNMIGIIPAVGAVEKFFLIKILFQKDLKIAGIIFGIGFFSLIIFAVKIFCIIFSTTFLPANEDQKIMQKEVFKNSSNTIAKELDFDSILILSPIAVALAMFLGLMFFPILIKIL